jgi:hypothetical protein
MPLVPYTAGQKLTAALLNAGLDNVQRTSYLTSDSAPVNNSTAFLTSSLQLSVVANASYLFDTYLVFDTTTVADFKIRLTTPTGTVTLTSSWGGLTTISTTDSTIVHDANILAPTTTIWVYGGWAGSGSLNSAIPHGAILVGANSGTLSVDYAQNTATAVNSVLKAGSWFRLTRVV